MDGSCSFADVLVDINHPDLDGVFTYCIPDDLLSLALPGTRVLVPFGRQQVIGLIIGLRATAQPGIKNILQVFDTTPVVPGDLLEIAVWLMEYYLCSPGQVLRMILPKGLKVERQYLLRLTSRGEASFSEIISQAALDPELQQILFKLTKQTKSGRAGIEKSKIAKGLLPRINQLVAQGLLSWEEQVSRREAPHERWVKLTLLPDDAAQMAKAIARRAAKQAAVIETLLAHGEMSLKSLCCQTAASQETIRALAKRGVIEICQVKLPSQVFSDLRPDGPLPPALTLAQQTALKELQAAFRQQEKSPVLLHGVTGSGKTEVYLRLIADVISSGKQAIMLVPEISLTPQMTEVFAARFPGRLAVLHSRLPQQERIIEWLRIRAGEVQVVIGARSAVFAPVQDLGVIIIDEEHENSYKQEEHPRYHVREVALQRSKLTGCLVILGSATPSLESYYRAITGDYQLVTMPDRIDGRRLPKVKIVDLREELKKGNRSIFSSELKEAIAAKLARQEQVILFLNRRGFATFVICRECGMVLRCPHCDISMTYHQQTNSLVCHYCSKTIPAPKVCPSCRSVQIRYFGAGTQRVEEEVKRLFPSARVVRMDVDTTRHKGDHHRLITAFASGEADILIGTQMIAKGLDFPGVTLVGIIAADNLLNLPDFRAGERTFQLLTQVAGRAGRGKLPGEVIIQSYLPVHPSIVFAKDHDFYRFFRQELEHRARSNYPPFQRMIKVVIQGPDEEKVQKRARVLAGFLRDSIEKLKSSGVTAACTTEVLGPAASAVAKVKDNFRWQVIIKGPDLNLMRDQMKQGQKLLRSLEHDNTVIIIDIEPMTLM